MISVHSLLLVSLATAVLANPLPLETRQTSASILLGNDDGWAEANVRAFYQLIKGQGNPVLLSAPAADQSGRGSSSTTPTTVTSGCQYSTCPARSPATGRNATDDHLWYVNAYPADGVQYGLKTLAATYLGGPPKLVLTGPNVGTNLGLVAQISGTVGAATSAALSGIPAIAFSATTGSKRSYTGLVPNDSSNVYAAAALRLTNALLASGSSPLLPAETILNVNFPAAGPRTRCTSGDSFKFVLSRVNGALGLPVDVETCGDDDLPSESSVVSTSGCYASVSVMGANNKLDVSASTQAVVLASLGKILTCLP